MKTHAKNLRRDSKIAHVSPGAHRRLKIMAVRNDTTIGEQIEKLLNLRTKSPNSRRAGKAGR
jgi:hypothetical protein